MELDNLDLQIIKMVQENAVRSKAYIARLLRVSEQVVRRRLKRLISEGYIKMVALPDPAKLGYTSEVLVGIQAKPGMVNCVENALAELSEVNWVMMTTGSFDIFIWATLCSQEELSKFLREKVGKIPHVHKLEAFINFGMKKRNYGPRI
ncbi:MAG: Lrp/AsnC family transcriptional regulator [Patescibacteria group bacterium]|mgnify:CR=1 FL=1